MKFTVTGIVLATGLSMIWKFCVPAGAVPELKSLAVTALLALGVFGVPLLKKKALSPIPVVIAGAVLGWLLL